MPELIPAAPGSPAIVLGDYPCCWHCDHDALFGQHNPPHATPCDHGCNDEVTEDA